MGRDTIHVESFKYWSKIDKAIIKNCHVLYWYCNIPIRCTYVSLRDVKILWVHSSQSSGIHQIPVLVISSMSTTGFLLLSFQNKTKLELLDILMLREWTRLKTQLLRSQANHSAFRWSRTNKLIIEVSIVTFVKRLWHLSSILKNTTNSNLELDFQAHEKRNGTQVEEGGRKRKKIKEENGKSIRKEHKNYLSTKPLPTTHSLSS